MPASDGLGPISMRTRRSGRRAAPAPHGRISSPGASTRGCRITCQESKMIQIPSAYSEGYARVERHYQVAADNYVKHTTIGDSVLDPIMEELSSLSPTVLHHFIWAGIEQHSEVLRKAPQSLRDFFESLDESPPWLDYDAFRPGIRAFHANVDLMLVAFVTGVLVEGFSTLIAKSFRITGRVAATKRRLQQNNRHMMDIFFPPWLVQGERRMEAVHAHSLRSFSNKDSAGQIRGLGSRSVGQTGQRGAPRVCHLRLLQAPVGVLAAGGRASRQGRKRECSQCLALRRLSHGDT